MGKRHQAPASEAWKQLALRFRWPEQRSYEIIRPVVLFGDSAEERARETGEPVRTLYRHLQRFGTEGFAGLTAAAHRPAPRALPPNVRQLIVDLKGEHPDLNPNEIARMCHAQLNYRPGARTIKRVLAETPPVPPAQRRYPPFHAMSPVDRRRAIIQLHIEGWGKQSIAAYLCTSRPTMDAILKRWATENLAALVPRSHAPKRRVRKVTLKVLLTIRRLQKNPRLGAFRMSAALKQALGVKLSPRQCGRIMALNRAIYHQPRAPKQPHEPQEMPFQATRRHQYWSIDIRYLDMCRLVGGMMYCITIMDNYSRAVLASVVTRSQDLTTYLFVFFLAVRNHGVPEAIVTDGGAVFRAKKALEIYHALGIRKEQIDKRQPWQSYIEIV
ncbi:MAG TPA: helix-turn-helix domain-containing protein [Herpetosiphonaceae bacterium]